MKKKLLLLLVLAYGAVSSYANSLTISNATTVTYNFNITTVSGGGTHCTTIITIPPGTTSFADPTSVPGLVGCAGITDEFIALEGFCSPYDIAIFSLTYTPNANTQSIGTNECNPGNPTTTFIWQPGVNANILII